jgi:IMP cyclohydrolase
LGYYTGCLNNIRQTDRQIKEVNGLKLLLRQLTGNDDSIYTREKRGIFNFIGGISKILFGTMDFEDANYYTDKISSLKNEQLNFLRLSKEQITVVKTTFRSINFTLLTVLENEKFLSKSLQEMANHVNEHDGEIREMFTAYSLLLSMNMPCN